MGLAATPAPGTDNGSTDCNITNQGILTNDPVNTGSRANCVSRWGLFDMVGNVWEWVADWVPLATSCSGSLVDADPNCKAGESEDFGTAALIRGGSSPEGPGAGVFAVDGRYPLTYEAPNVRFRCVR